MDVYVINHNKFEFFWVGAGKGGAYLSPAHFQFGYLFLYRTRPNTPFSKKYTVDLAQIGWTGRDSGPRASLPFLLKFRDENVISPSAEIH